MDILKTDITKLSSATDTFIKIGIIIGTICSIGAGYSFYKDNFWTPTVTPISVDYANGIATITYKGMFGKTNTVQIYGNATFGIGGDWGVRFGTTTNNTGTSYNRLELTNSGMVQDYINAPGS